MWGSVRDDGKAKGAKIRQRTSPASSTSALFPQMKPLFQSEAKREAIDWKIIFYSLIFTLWKGFALSLVLKMRVFGPRSAY